MAVGPCDSWEGRADAPPSPPALPQVLMEGPCAVLSRPLAPRTPKCMRPRLWESPLGLSFWGSKCFFSSFFVSWWFLLKAKLEKLPGLAKGKSRLQKLDLHGWKAFEDWHAAQYRPFWGNRLDPGQTRGCHVACQVHALGPNLQGGWPNLAELNRISREPKCETKLQSMARWAAHWAAWIQWVASDDGMLALQVRDMAICHASIEGLGSQNVH